MLCERRQYTFQCITWVFFKNDITGHLSPWLRMCHNILTPVTTPTLHGNVVLHSIVMQGLSAATINSLPNIGHPPEMEMNPLKTVGSCLCDRVTTNWHNHNPLNLWTACVQAYARWPPQECSARKHYNNNWKTFEQGQGPGVKRGRNYCLTSKENRPITDGDEWEKEDRRVKPRNRRQPGRPRLPWTRGDGEVMLNVLRCQLTY